MQDAGWAPRRCRQSPASRRFRGGTASRLGGPGGSAGGRQRFDIIPEDKAEEGDVATSSGPGSSGVDVDGGGGGGGGILLGLGDSPCVPPRTPPLSLCGSEGQSCGMSTPPNMPGSRRIIQGTETTVRGGGDNAFACSSLTACVMMISLLTFLFWLPECIRIHTMIYEIEYITLAEWVKIACRNEGESVCSVCVCVCVRRAKRRHSDWPYQPEPNADENSDTGACVVKRELCLHPFLLFSKGFLSFAPVSPF